MSNITGRLLNARRQSCPGGHYIIGAIYEDTRRKFDDGAIVSTSLVTSEEGNIILTRNSVYEVKSWA